MKKVLSIFSTLLFCVVMLIGCAKADPVQEDLLNYLVKQVPTLVEPEDKVTTEYAAVTGKNFTDDATLGAKLKDVVIPASNELLKKAKLIVPTTEEVSKVHNKYVAAFTEQHEAFNLLLQAVQKGDEALVKTVNEKLLNAGKVAKEYLADLETLKKEHKLIYEKLD